MEYLLKAIGEVLRDKDFTIGVLKDKNRRLETEVKDLKEQVSELANKSALLIKEREDSKAIATNYKESEGKTNE